MQLKAFFSTMVPLNSDELDFLNSFIKTETVEKGAFHLREGQICHRVSFINEGFFKMSMGGSTGSENIIELLGPLEFVTDYISFLKQKPTDCNIEALRRSVIESLGFNDLQKIYDYSPAFQKIGRLLAEQNFIRLGERVKSQSLPPQERYRLLCQNTTLMQEVPQYMIASYLGVSAEWLSKIRAKGQVLE